MSSDCHLQKNDNRLAPHPVHIWKKKCKLDEHAIWLSFCFANDNRMTCSSGLHFFPNVNWMGVPSGCHFQNKMRTGWSSFGCYTARSGKLPVHHRQLPKHQINYSNQQYHLLIANKHKKLLTYDLFEGLIEDLGERNETDELWTGWASSSSHQICSCRSMHARGSKGCYGVNQMKTRVIPKASDCENNESD